MRPLQRTSSDVIVLFSTCWCSRRSMAADMVLRCYCPPDVYLMFRSPSSMSAPACA